MEIYKLKDKIKATPEFITDIIRKSWAETSQLQQQIANIDTNNVYGKKVVDLLQNLCTNYYVFIGCLEAISDQPDAAYPVEEPVATTDPVLQEYENESTEFETELATTESNEVTMTDTQKLDFEPFEYFVDFDEPIGEPMSDEDLYG